MAEEVLILHGWQNRRPAGHWQHWLAGELETRDVQVRYPQLPEPDAPVLGEWLDALESQLAGIDPSELTVVAHSLGCLLWMAHAARRADSGATDAVARRVVLAAPAAPDVLRGIPEVAAFTPVLEGDAARRALAATALERPIIVASGEDPFCPEGAEQRYAIPLALDFVPVQGGGHLTIEDGYGPFPLVRDLITG
ncbi:RBBP9/YdeN family alpha/beta hydrolase [Agromyces bauzanensis]